MFWFAREERRFFGYREGKRVASMGVLVDIDSIAIGGYFRPITSLPCQNTVDMAISRCDR
jgi:hypothetical protein